jgi:hypothetical protein
MFSVSRTSVSGLGLCSFCSATAPGYAVAVRLQASRAQPVGGEVRNAARNRRSSTGMRIAWIEAGDVRDVGPRCEPTAANGHHAAQRARARGNPAAEDKAQGRAADSLNRSGSPAQGREYQKISTTRTTPIATTMMRALRTSRTRRDCNRCRMINGPPPSRSVACYRCW